MSNPAIKAALEAAAQAAREATDRNGYVPPSIEDRTAAAVAAFFRSLPPLEVGHDGGRNTRIIIQPPAWCGFAAAVEEAARDG